MQRKAKHFPYLSLAGNCLANRTLPSTSFWRNHSCSLKYKGIEIDRWVTRQYGSTPCYRLVGFDLGEGRRSGRFAAKPSHQGVRANDVVVYPLQLLGLDRAGCERVIAAACLPSPGLSACVFCAAMRPEEVDKLEIEELWLIVILEAHVQITLKRIRGLWRHGERMTADIVRCDLLPANLIMAVLGEHGYESQPSNGLYHALPPLTIAAEPVYTLPPLLVKNGCLHFRSMFIDPADALAEAIQSAAWRQHLDPAGLRLPLRPLTPLKIGHMNSIIAAGHLNNQVLANGTERLLIKGRNYKVARTEEYQEPLPDGRTRVTHLETESVVTDITTVDTAGQVAGYKGADLEQFLLKWITPLTGIVAQDYPPVYQFDLNGYGHLLGSLSKQRPIPGLNGKSGLLPAQKHAAAAALTRLETE